MRWRFSNRYLIATVVLFLVEVAIALFVRDAVIRPYGGDVLVVALIYCALRTVLQVRPSILVIATVLFAYTVEFLQLFHLVAILGLEQYRLARIVLGTSFAWLDLLAYTIGGILVLCVEKLRRRDAATAPGAG